MIPATTIHQPGNGFGAIGTASRTLGCRPIQG
jgi:hypothetical protein